MMTKLEKLFAKTEPPELRSALLLGIKVLMVFVSLLGVVVLYDELSQALNLKSIPPQIHTGLAVIILDIGVSLALATIWHWIEHRPSKNSATANGADIAEFLDDLMGELEDAKLQRHWDVILRFGRVMLRPLWIAGRYNTLEKLGAMVEDAAAHANEPRDHATALIDALGWTSHKLGRTGVAEKNINHGMEIAERCGAFDLVYKARRHLVGIAVANGDLNRARKELQLAGQAIAQITNVEQKKCALAGQKLSVGIVLEADKNLQGALKSMREAQELYAELNDAERLVKTHQYIAAVYKKTGNLGGALDSHRRGLESALKLQRRDAIAENAHGAAELYLELGDGGRAAELFIRAADAYALLGQPDKAARIRNRGISMLALKGG